jgi:hypothetical protein
VTWDQIRQQFTDADIEHMKAITGGQLDLGDCQSVKQFAKEIFRQVNSGAMPPGQPWSDEWKRNFADWMVEGSPCPDLK